MGELGRSSLFFSFGAGSRYPRAPLSSDDQSSDLSEPMLKLTMHATMTVNIASTCEMYAILLGMLLLTRLSEQLSDGLSMNYIVSPRVKFV
jgi:hypothetical protein